MGMGCVPDQRDAVPEDPGRKGRATEVVGIISDVGNDICKCFDDGIPILGAHISNFLMKAVV